ncbi:MAG TPA: nucleoside 2-deoxyribosyltransferase [Anaerolineales bacterium]|nr:nucleoside 2-deoxyribosyltransferase [Anaerolineales bacterium]
MKIYFAFTAAADRSSLQVARKIVSVLEAMGHGVLTKHLVRDDVESDRLLSPQEVYQRDMEWLQECDCFVAEVSGSSFGLGFETGYLLASTSKKVILLYRRDLEKKISFLITGNTHPGCSLIPYSDIEEMELVVRDRLRE